jgi:tryptophan synthase alpha chain
MGGFPDLGASLEIGRACVRAGADVLELGVPFSDPLADGPVIQAAGTVALKAGATLDGVLEVAGQLCQEGAPVVVMCYSNMILTRGLERFCERLVAAGVSGLIVPDLPLEESDDALRACDERGLALVPLVAPTTPDDRLELIGARARGFVYTVSLTGTTGERALIAEALGGLVARVRARTEVPVAVGFGIGTPEQASLAADAGADGVIIGSRLVRAAGGAGDPAEAVGTLVGQFSDALSAGLVK